MFHSPVKKQPMCIIVFFTKPKIWKQSKCLSVDEQIKNMWYTCICPMEYYSTIRKEEILPFVTTQMKLEGIILREISQTEKDKHCRTSLTYMGCKKAGLAERESRMIMTRG